jgi:hypothetical protein
MPRIAIPLKRLQELGACLEYENSPGWNKATQELVYEDLGTEVERLAVKEGGKYLMWLVFAGLIPITQKEAEAVIARLKKAST